jgi:crotonobetainyl-CoA:carnitine CoA-transferase CaiB-like acyl-CoA transferase
MAELKRLHLSTQVVFAGPFLKTGSAALKNPESNYRQRFTVLDLTRDRSGPTCVRHLADWSVNVVRSARSQPGGLRRDSRICAAKRTRTLNLTESKSFDVFKRLAEQVDVENCFPDVKSKRIDCESLRQSMASISALGLGRP